jgi:WD40 repeat protein
MGGLIARWFLEVLEGRELTRTLITVGTPYQGSVNALDALVNGLFLGLGPIGISVDELLRSFPSVYQLLPTYPCLDVGDGELRKISGLDLPNTSVINIEEGLAFHAKIGASVENVPRYQSFVVKGVDQPTGQSAILRERKIESLRSYKGEDKGGDGTVPRPSSHPPEWEDERASTFVSQKHAILQSTDSLLTQVAGMLTGDRLAHQALADYYRHRVDIGEAQGRIVAALTKGIAGAGWLDCDRYLWRHLSDHAAQAGRLDALIRDPGYLATADPARLVTVLPVIQDKGARRFADIYNRVADRLIRRPPLERLPLVHMTAQMEAPDLAPRLEPPVPTSWRCRWARVSSSSPHRIIGRHSAGVRAIALGTIDGRAVVISGSDDHSVRIWDPRTGIQIGKPLSGHSLGVSAVALGAVDDGVIVASGSWDQTIQLWDARTGEPIGKPLHGHNPVRGLSLEYPKERQRQHDLVRGIGGPYTGIEESRTSGILNVAFGTVNGRTIVASAGEDGTIRLWDARKGESFGEVLEGHTDAVSAVVFSEIDNHAIVVSGSWDGTIRRWNACSGEPIGEPLKGHTDAINAITLGVIDGVSVIVSGSRDGTIRSWHAETGAPIGRRIDWLEGLAIPAVAIGRVNGDPTVVWAPAFQNAIYLSDAHTGEIRRTLRGHQDDVGTIAVGAIDGRVVVVSGSVDGTVRLWDPRTEEPVRESTVTVRALAFATIEGRPIVASAGWDGNVLLWDAKTGDRFGSLIEGHRECAEAIALGEMDGHPVVVSGDEDHTIRLWDARTGKPIREPLRTEHPVKKVALGVVNGDPFLVSAGWEDLRLWTPLIGKPNSREFGDTWTLREGISVIALGELKGRPVVVSGGRGGTMQLWDPFTGRMIQRFRSDWPKMEKITAVALGEIDGRAVVISASEDQYIRLWDTQTGKLIAIPLKPYRKPNSIALAEACGGAAVLSAGEDEIAVDRVFTSEDAAKVEFSRSDDQAILLRWSRRTITIKLPQAVNFLAFRADVGMVVGLEKGLLVFELPQLATRSNADAIQETRPAESAEARPTTRGQPTPPRHPFWGGLLNFSKWLRILMRVGGD